MKSAFRAILAAWALLMPATALAADRYVVAYASRQAEGPALTVVSDVSIDPDNASEEVLRSRLEGRLGDRRKDFLVDIAIFGRREDADAFRQQLLDRAGATGAVELLPVSVAEQSVELWRDHESEFNSWPFSAAEAKRRQLRASELWKLPVTMTVANRDFVLIPPGEFIMGSPPEEPNRGDDEPQHRVRITTPFYLARDDEPFETRGWRGFLQGIFEQAPEGYRFRLATEAEWEYAARAGTAGPTYSADGTIPADFGNSAMPKWNANDFGQTESEDRWAMAKGGTFLRFYASCKQRGAFGGNLVPLPANPMPCRNFAMSVDDVFREGLDGKVVVTEKARPGPRRGFSPNAWGLYDMLGHYDEAVSDFYLPYTSDPITVDPRQAGDLMDMYRNKTDLDYLSLKYVWRGGHFVDDRTKMRVARRRQGYISYNYIAPNGMRLVLEKATGEARSDRQVTKNFLDALKDYQDGLGEQRKTGPDPLPAPH